MQSRDERGEWGGELLWEGDWEVGGAGEPGVSRI